MSTSYLAKAGAATVSKASAVSTVSAADGRSPAAGASGFIACTSGFIACSFAAAPRTAHTRSNERPAKRDLRHRKNKIERRKRVRHAVLVRKSAQHGARALFHHTA